MRYCRSPHFVAHTILIELDTMVSFVLQLMYALGGGNLDHFLFELPLARQRSSQETSSEMKPWRTWSLHSWLKVETPTWTLMPEAIQRCLACGVVIEREGRYWLCETFKQQLSRARIEARRWYGVLGLEYLCYVFPRSAPFRSTYVTHYAQPALTLI